MHENHAISLPLIWMPRRTWINVGPAGRPSHDGRYKPFIPSIMTAPQGSKNATRPAVSFGRAARRVVNGLTTFQFIDNGSRPQRAEDATENRRF